MQNCVDTAFILPQYLVLRTSPVLQVGWLFAIGSPKCKGKSFTEEPSWQPRRRQKRRNTNRRRDDTSHTPRFLTGLLREAPLKGLFLVRRRRNSAMARLPMCHNRQTARLLPCDRKWRHAKKTRRSTKRMRPSSPTNSISVSAKWLSC